MSDDNDPLIGEFFTPYPEVDRVRLYTSTFEGHIAEDHREVYENVGLKGIELTVSNPDFVYSGSNTRSVVFERNNVFEGKNLQVPVKIVKGTSGRIRTAFLTRTSKTKPYEIIWRKDNVD